MENGFYCGMLKGFRVARRGLLAGARWLYGYDVMYNFPPWVLLYFTEMELHVTLRSSLNICQRFVFYEPTSINCKCKETYNLIGYRTHRHLFLDPSVFADWIRCIHVILSRQFLMPSGISNMPGARNIVQSRWQPLPLIRNQWWDLVTSNNYQRLSPAPQWVTLFFNVLFHWLNVPHWSPLPIIPGPLVM